MGCPKKGGGACYKGVSKKRKVDGIEEGKKRVGDIKPKKQQKVEAALKRGAAKKRKKTEEGEMQRQQGGAGFGI